MDHVNERIEAFVDWFVGVKLADLSDSDFNQVSISSTFYEELLCQKVYTDLISKQHREYSIKVWHNFLLNVKLGVGNFGELEVERQSICTSKSCA